MNKTQVLENKKNLCAIEKIPSYFMLVLCFLYYVLQKLAKGGRWGIGVPLAVADRFWDHMGSLYSNIDEGLLSSCTYFPGSVYVALISRYFFGKKAESAMIVFATITLIVAIILFIRMVEMRRGKVLWYVCLFLITFEFPLIKFYSLEMHPDVPTITFFLVGYFLSMFYLQSERNIRSLLALVLSIVFLIIGGIFKQNSVFLFAGYGLYLIIEKQIEIKKRIIVLACVFFAGIIVVANIICLDNCWLSTITVNSRHSFMSMRSYLLFGFYAICNNKIYIVLLLLFGILLLTGKIKIENMYQKGWLFCALFWFAFSMIGALKDGANEGNMEAAIFPLLPFALLVVLYFCNLPILKRYIQKYDWKISDKWKQSSGIVFEILALIFAVFLAINPMQSNYREYRERCAQQEEMAEWINKQFEGKTIAISTYTYGVYNGTKAQLSSDLFTVSLFDMAGLVDDAKLNQISDENNWEGIVTVDDYSENMWPITFADFERVEESQFSTQLPISVYVRKK